MAVTSASFRANFPEFDSILLYPPSAINYWLRVGEELIREEVWTTLRDTAVELFIAHNATLEARAQAEAVNGAPPGMTSGPKSAESVDKVSVSYDTSAGIDAGAGHWNLTVYGTRLHGLIKQFGARPLQL